MERYKKFMRQLGKRQRQIVLDICGKIFANQLEGLTFERIKTNKDLYRIRVGKIRIVFRKGKGANQIVNISFRDKAYKRLFR